MEPFFGRDLSQVRVHLGEEAEQAARSIQARAFTISNHVFFGRGEYRPGSPDGNRLLSHELTHVLRSADTGPLIVRRSPSSSSKGADPEQKEVPTPDNTSKVVSIEPAVAARAQALTREMLDFILAQAKQRAAQPKVLPKNSSFVARLKGHYLSEYLASPNPQSGQLAIAKIGAEADQTKLDMSDVWEASIPKFTLGVPAATEILKKENRAKLSHIDGNVLLGGAKPGTSPNNDFISDGANESQLMHWATGVKYSHFTEERIKKLFLAYEIMHLEGWGEFGFDAINDLIAEEQGRILGLRLSSGSLTGETLNAELTATFAEARAWVGSLIQMRRAELDNILFREMVVTELSWYDGSPATYWEPRSVYSRYVMVAGDEGSVAALTASLKTSNEIAKLIDIYALAEESKLWQSKNRSFSNEGLGALLEPAAIQSRMDLIKESKGANAKP